MYYMKDEAEVVKIDEKSGNVTVHYNKSVPSKPDFIVPFRSELICRHHTHVKKSTNTLI